LTLIDAEFMTNFLTGLIHFQNVRFLIIKFKEIFFSENYKKNNGKKDEGFQAGNREVEQISYFSKSP